MKRTTVIRAIIGIGIFLGMLLHFWLAINRYFDPDEFAHFHWAYLFTLGLKPYKDFFIYHIPFFQFFLLPFFILPHTAETFLFVRILMFVILGITQLVSALIVKKLIKSELAFYLTFFLILIFPLMTDKSIEIRPDVLMILLFMIPLYLSFSFSTWKRKHAVIAGLSLGTSIMIFPKIMFAFPALLVLFLFDPVTTVLRSHKLPNKRELLHFLIFAGTTAIPGVLFLFYLFVMGIVPQGIFSIFTATKLIYADLPMKYSPFIIFEPWPLVYMNNQTMDLKPNFPWLVSVILMITAAAGFVMIGVERKWKLFLFYLVFFVSSYMYLMLLPLKFILLQYYMPMIFIGAPLSAFFFARVATLLKRNLFIYLLCIGIVVTGLVSYVTQLNDRLAPIDTNQEQMQVIRDVTNHIKPKETVYDMVGSYLYRPPAYVFCCHRYADFIYKFKDQPPILKDSLIANQTKFIVLDRSGFAFWVVPEPTLTFIKSSYMTSAYRKIYTVGFRYACNLGTCSRVTFEDRPVEGLPNNVAPVFIAEKYKVTTTPPDKTVTFGDKTVLDGNSIDLQNQNYTFYVSPDVTQVMIQLDR
jgi:hypothetical protein